MNWKLSADKLYTQEYQHSFKMCTKPQAWCKKKKGEDKYIYSYLII